MAALRWRHGVTSTEARRVMQEKLEQAGYADKLKWSGNSFSASVGWGKILNLRGEIDDDVAVLDQCSGAIGGIVLGQVREMLIELCPDGEMT